MHAYPLKTAGKAFRKTFFHKQGRGAEQNNFYLGSVCRVLVPERYANALGSGRRLTIVMEVCFIGLQSAKVRYEFVHLSKFINILDS
jgi:hypothetical protein